ncbi:BsuBI/PstI family type II restriction endonuclease [Streptomyces sp. NPDC012616]|uniref:BsuBI/PstI family type II restriction endonuclease n=1 Tax=Streptomyces sp. NPDC012616 TaxID=3364840 RepID=UPI0036E12DD6
MTDVNTGNWPLPALLPSREAYQQRLELILPSSVTGVTYTANPAAAALAFTAMYVGAVDNVHPIRPTTVTWMSDAVAAHREDEERKAYYTAAISKAGEKAVKDLCTASEYDRGDSWYANNSREPVRDESINALKENGAILVLTDIPTTSARPRYTLEPGFAALLSPELTGDDLTDAIAQWQATHLTPTGRRRAALLSDPSRSAGSVVVHLPGGGTRTLHPGASSLILKGVVEQFAIAKLQLPNVIFISQSGEKVNLLDGKGLDDMGLHVDQALLLPDCIIADLAEDKDEIWFIEVVATDGPITEKRKQDLLDWATSQNHPAERCRFLTAFQSRTSSAAKKALPQLAGGSHAWFANEPEGLLSWDDLDLG